MPRLTGGDPATPDPANGAVDVEHLEQQLELVAAQLHPRLERGRGQRAVAGAEHVQHPADALRSGEGHGGEPRPDGLVLIAGQQQHVGVLHGAAGAADLLVVGDRRVRRAEVDDEAEVGLVEPHAECGRGDQSLDLVVEQRPFQRDPLLGVGAAGVGADLVTGGPQRLRDVDGLRDRQGVDDPGAGQVSEVLGEPRQPVVGGQPQHSQA